MIKHHSKAKLEEMAQDWLKKHGQYDGRCLRLEHSLEQAGYLIIPVEGLAEIAEAYLPAQPSRIYVDADQYSKSNSFRWTFTLAEELAHDILHRPMFAGMGSKKIRELQEHLSDEEYELIERQAKL